MKNRIRHILIICALFILLGSSYAFAADRISYVDENDEIRHRTDYELLGGSGSEVTLGNSEGEIWYVIADEQTFSEHIFIKGTVNIILCDDASATCEESIVVEGLDQGQGKRHSLHICVCSERCCQEDKSNSEMR